MQPVLNPELDDNRDLVVVEKWSIILYRYQRGSVYLLRFSINFPPFHRFDTNRLRSPLKDAELQNAFLQVARQS